MNEAVRPRPGLRFASRALPRFGALAAALTGCLTVAAALRLIGITYGLPYLLYPDEWALVMPALSVAQTGDLHPGRFDYGSLFIYMLALVFRGAASLGVLPPLAQIPSFDPVQHMAWYPLPTVFLLGRLLALTLNGVGVAAVYAAGRRLFGPAAGLVAALLIAVSPLSVQLARYAITDPAAQAATAVGLWLTVLVYERAAWRRSILAGLAVGLGASIKYPVAVLGFALLVAHLLTRSRPDGLRPTLVGLALVPLAFLLGTPFAALDWPMFVHWLQYDRNLYAPHPSGYVEGPSGLWYARYLLTEGDRVTALLGVVGWAALAVRHWRLALLLAVFPILLFTLMSTAGLRYARALLPILPFLALAAGWLVASLAAHRQPWARGLAVGLTLLSVGFPLAATLAHTRVLLEPDSRTLAAAWAAENLDPHTPVAADRFGPPVGAPGDEFRRVQSILDHPAAWYAERDYTVFASDVWWLNDSRTWEQAELLAAFEADPSLEQVAHIRGHMWGYPEFGIRVYRPRRP